MPDSHRNFSYSHVVTAPSPALSGTSLIVTAGGGLLFPTPPFNATVWPSGSNPLATNAEIVRVTAIVTDTLTITRTQESSTARAVIVGDQIAATVTAKVLTDAELGHVIEDEGVPLTQRSNLNFVGAGVTVTDSTPDTIVTIPGGSGGLASVVDDPIYRMQVM